LVAVELVSRAKTVHASSLGLDWNTNHFWELPQARHNRKDLAEEIFKPRVTPPAVQRARGKGLSERHACHLVGQWRTMQTQRADGQLRVYPSTMASSFCPKEHLRAAPEAGALVLLDAGLYCQASSRQPSGGSIGAIIGPRIEGNRRSRGSLTNSVDDGFE
jgi:hypothetical protein